MVSRDSGAEELLGFLDTATRRLMSAATLVELGIVLEVRFGPVGAAIVERLLRSGDIEVVEVDRQQADLAIDAWRRYGKGRHAAGLNLGDCFSYALTAQSGSALVCVGDDFVRTDLEVKRPASTSQG